ncbi:OmpP1/FadL family transporter [Allochromatium palmeri]|uniref:Aromatic hydrocarbon degradation protein n=1 Tax=Allochromatium palmeri TaxID=231048 RepID=A0A6N8ECL2_9GAMM|nr:porin [Allochromatium palmeri]MTW21230.1 aromatic hydrocarbon degradation protein [Allochromatium palmeri]
MFTPTITRSMALCLAVSVCGTQAVQASGFMLPESSTAGIGLSNALVANPDERGAFAYNPAAMGFHATSSLAVGTYFIGPNFSVDTASGHHDSQGADWMALPMIQGAFSLDERWRLGLGVSVPFGLETRWSDGTFPAVSGTRSIGAYSIPLGHPLTSKLEIIDVSPTVAYRLNDALSLSAGIDVYWARQAKLDSTLGTLTGDGYGFGFNLGALYRQGPWSLGAAFRSSATLELEGDFVPKSSVLVSLGRLARAQTGELDLALPWRLQLGARYAFDERLAVEFDISRSGWSAFNDIKVTSKATGALIFVDQNDWNDANAYRLGATYQWNDQTQLRFGYTYDETGQDDDHFSARVPDNDRHLFSLGLAQSLGNGLSLEAAYMYVRAVERDYRGASPYTGGDLNGSTALAGDYSMDAHLIGLEIVKVF